MINFKITQANIQKWPQVLENIFKWNENKDIILHTYYGHLFLYHTGIFSKFNRLCENQSVKFNIELPYMQTQTGTYFTPFIKFKETVQKTPDSNAMIAVQYIEQIPEDYIIVKQSNLNNFCNINKEIILFEIHSAIMSNYSILDYIEINNEDFIYDTDFNKFNKNVQKLNSKIIKIRGKE